MTPRFALLSCAFATVLFGARAQAEEPIQALPCRPTVACTAEIVPGGVAEIESGVLTRWEEGASLAAPVLGKLSVTNEVQLQVGTTENTSVDHGAFADMLNVIAKVVVARTGGVTLAVTGGGSKALLPESNSYAPAQGWAFAGLASRDFGALHLDVNGGYNRLRGDGTVTQSGWGALSTSFAWTRRLSSFHELYYLGAPRLRVAPDAGFLFGVAYAVRPEVVLDVGADLGLLEHGRSSSMFFGLTAIIGRLYGAASAEKVAHARGTRVL